MRKRGTEKPIEIFVALFVILAVALVMLKLFQSQITDKQKQLSDFQQEQKVQEMKNKVVLHCQSKCTEASNNGCSRQSLATLCLANSRQVLRPGEYLDLDGNNEISYNMESFGGEGVCEDKVYCFNGLVDTCCAQKIDAGSCGAILSQFWTDKGWDVEDRCNSFFNDYGTCESEDPDDEDFAWWLNEDLADACST